MKRFLILLILFFSIFLSGCFVKIDVVDPQSSPEFVSSCGPKNFVAFGTEPFWELEIDGNVATFFEMSMEDYENKFSVPVYLKGEGNTCIFWGEHLDGKFLEKDCIDGGKGDIHYYTVSVIYNDKVFEGCGDDERGIKVSDDNIVVGEEG